MCVAAGLVFLLVRRIDWPQFQQIVAHHGLKLYLWLIPIAGLGWLVYVWRWRILLLPLGVSPSFRELVSDSLVGLFYGLFVPTGLAGDAVRAIKLGNRHHAMQKTALSVIVDRMIGLFSVMLLLGVQLVRNSPVLQGLRLSWTGWAILATLIIAGVAIGCGGRLWHRRSVRWMYQKKQWSLLRHWSLDWLVCQVDRWWGLVREYADARSYIVWSTLASVAYQLVVTLLYHTAGMTFGIHVGFGDYVWIVALVSLAQVLPITVAGLGVREGLFAFLLSQYGVSATTSVALSLAVFSVTLLFAIVGGILELISAVGAAPGTEERQLTHR